MSFVQQIDPDKRCCRPRGLRVRRTDLRLVGGGPEGAAGGSSQHQGFGSSGGQKKKRQKHHSFLPLHSEDFWGLTFTALGLMIAAGGGIGASRWWW